MPVTAMVLTETAGGSGSPSMGFGVSFSAIAAAAGVARGLARIVPGGRRIPRGAVELNGSKTGRETAGEMFAFKIGPLNMPFGWMIKPSAGESW